MILHFAKHNRDTSLPSHICPIVSIKSWVKLLSHGIAYVEISESLLLVGMRSDDQEDWLWLPPSRKSK